MNLDGDPGFISKGRRVYIARCIGPDGGPMGAFKIGCSHNHELRIRSVTANLPFSLELVAVFTGGWVMEAACHLHLRQHRIAGEYIRATEETERFVSDAAKRGEPFYYFTDLGSDSARDEAFDAFAAFHEVTLKEACKFVGTTPKRYETQKSRNTRRMIAAVGLIAAGRKQFARWPEDVVNGLLGETYSGLRKKFGVAA